MSIYHEPERPARYTQAFSHTFLFADLVGFTALAEVEGDERALEVALGLQRCVRRLLEEHGGEQVKAIGDGLMLRFGDARPAVLLGVQLVEELAGEADFLPVRVGVHTGPALFSDGDWYGRTVNVAARLCALAPVGGVIVSARTREAVGQIDGIEWSSRELRRLRNVSAPVATCLASTVAAADRSRRREPAAPHPPAWLGVRAASEVVA
ncbi:MAG TPA: adenylate/guanylate cyclase domain-containing protein [Solirubrobacteraceae bacterium]|nr:adenylate/guanylate cyclase domain-containing protein [Solirubrobacteraceae bacterium]